MKTKTDSVSTEIATEPKWIEIVRDYVGDIRFGSVQIVVHEGRVTQVDATRRTRLAGEPVSSTRI